jgi:serine/threonine protein kinase
MKVVSHTQHHDMIGKVIGTYQILRELGQGVHGTVYQAIDQARGQMVVLKAVQADLLRQTVIKQNLRALATTLMQLQHPQLTTFHTLLQVGNDLYLVSEFVEGVSLAETLQQTGVLSLEQAVGLARQALEALSYVHQVGLVHGGLHPNNLLLTPNGQLKITDLSLTLAAGPSLMHIGLGPAILNYVAPEQIHGETSDARTDLYALGAVLYELMTGLPPFRRANDAALLKAHLEETPPSPRNYFPLIPLELEQVLLRALAKPPAARFQSADEFQAALQTWALTESNVPAASVIPAAQESEAPLLPHTVQDFESAPPAVQQTEQPPVNRPELPVRQPDTLIDLPAQLVPNSWPQFEAPASTPAQIYSGVLPNAVTASPLHQEVVVDLEETGTAKRSFWKPIAAVTCIATLLGASYAMVRLKNGGLAASGTPRVILQASPTATPTPQNELTLDPTPLPTTESALATASSPTPTPSPVKAASPAPVAVAPKPAARKPAPVKPGARPGLTPPAKPVRKKAAPAPPPAPAKNEKKKKKKDGGVEGSSKGASGGKKKNAAPSSTPKVKKKKP